MLLSTSDLLESCFMSIEPKTSSISPEQMSHQVVRFKSLKAQSASAEKNLRIPVVTNETTTANKLLILMTPRNLSSMSADTAIINQDNLSVMIIECPPGNKPMSHVNFQTNEHFFCLKGKFKIRCGDEDESEILLDQWDMIAVPKGVNRDFTNVTDEIGYLLVLITETNESDYVNISTASRDSEGFCKRFSDKIAEKFAKICADIEIGIKGSY